ncbi:hypothetical protein D9M72_497370 [compost metagenome]
MVPLILTIAKSKVAPTRMKNRPAGNWPMTSLMGMPTRSVPTPKAATRARSPALTLVNEPMAKAATRMKNAMRDNDMARFA